MINKATLLGRVGKDPEIRNLDNGTKVANFSIATSENWTDKNGEKKEATEWHNISIFGKLADIVERYVKKGQLLYIEGKIKTRSWDQDGVKKYMTEVVLNGFGDVLKMIGRNEDQKPASYSGAEVTNPSNRTVTDDIAADDLPF